MNARAVFNLASSPHDSDPESRPYCAKLVSRVSPEEEEAGATAAALKAAELLLCVVVVVVVVVVAPPLSPGFLFELVGVLELVDDDGCEFLGADRGPAPAPVHRRR